MYLLNGEAINSDLRKPSGGVHDANSNILARNKITEDTFRAASVVCLYPETHRSHSELSQAGHTQDFHIVTDASSWKV